jgi:hypothetical protein
MAAVAPRTLRLVRSGSLSLHAPWHGTSPRTHAACVCVGGGGGGASPCCNRRVVGTPSPTFSPHQPLPPPHLPVPTPPCAQASHCPARRVWPRVCVCGRPAAGLLRSVALWTTPATAPALFPVGARADAATRRLLLLRWVVRALRALPFPPGATAPALAAFHRCSVAGVVEAALGTFAARSGFGYPGRAPRPLGPEATACRRLARGALQEAFVCSRWLPPVRRPLLQAARTPFAPFYHRCSPPRSLPLPPTSCTYPRTPCASLRQASQTELVARARAALRAALNTHVGRALEDVLGPGGPLDALGRHVSAAVGRDVDGLIATALPMPDHLLASRCGGAGGGGEAMLTTRQ